MHIKCAVYIISCLCSFTSMFLYFRKISFETSEGEKLEQKRVRGVFLSVCVCVCETEKKRDKNYIQV